MESNGYDTTNEDYMSTAVELLPNIDMSQLEGKLAGYSFNNGSSRKDTPMGTAKYFKKRFELFT